MAIAIAGMLAVGLIAGRIPTAVAAFYVAMGLVSAAQYTLDKWRARQDAWRVAEFRLHAVDLCGGVVGGALAQTLLHHKTRKPGFQARTFAIETLHLLGLVLLLTGPWDGWR